MTSVNPAPRVSVLLPVRDGGLALRSALRSALRQTFTDFEIVAVDDGSQDETAARLQTWARRDGRLRVVHLAPSGLISALNQGLEICRGEFIARLDADDVMLPRRLERQVEWLEKRPETAVVSCRVRCFPRRRLGQGFKIYQEWLNGLLSAEDHRRERFVESPIAHPTAFMSRALLEDVGGYREVSWAEDYDLWLRLLEKGHRIEKIDEILYLWRDHPERQTRVNSRYRKSSFLACKAHFLHRGPLQDAKKIWIWGAGPTGKAIAKELRTLDHSIDGFFDIDAKKLRRRPGGSPVYSFTELPKLWTPGDRLLIAVSRRGARELIRPHVLDAGLVEGKDVFFVA